jgi:hypothetical protein
MRALVIAAALLFAVAPAYAQKKSDAEKAADAARQKEQDELYKASLRRIQAKEAASNDPWGAVRNDPPQGKPKTPANTAR